LGSESHSFSTGIEGSPSPAPSPTNVSTITIIQTAKTLLSPPNQSLKLTEVAVDDFAARQSDENDMISRYVRAMNYMELAVRRRSLAPVR